jgi:geranylgeranyl transferase type-2 subunit beta
MDYLTITDELLLDGISRTSKRFMHHQMEWLETRWNPDGGFQNRAGGSDLYYTDFGVRCLALLGAERKSYQRVANYLTTLPMAPVTVVEWFNLLNIRRILTRYGDIQVTFEPPHGISIHKNPYDLFLNALCLGMTGETPKSSNGFAIEIKDIPQTSLLAAWAGYLLVVESNEKEMIEACLNSIAAFRHTDGGYLAHQDAPQSDLLSTYSAFLTLGITNRIRMDDLAETARFVKSCANIAGGFSANPYDTETDVEYTYYGLGLIGLIRSISECV